MRVPPQDMHLRGGTAAVVKNLVNYFMHPSSVRVGAAVALAWLLYASGCATSRPLSHDSSADSSMQATDERELCTRLHELAPWGPTADYSESAWQYTRNVAVVIQQAQPNTVILALEQFERETTDYEEMSKVFILMRLLFDLPEDAPVSERFNFAAWDRGDADLVGPRTVNLAWPLSYHDGAPTLMQGRPNAQGPPYAAASEYRYLIAKYPFRQL